MNLTFIIKTIISNPSSQLFPMSSIHHGSQSLPPPPLITTITSSMVQQKESNVSATSSMIDVKYSGQGGSASVGTTDQQIRVLTPSEIMRTYQHSVKRVVDLHRSW